MSEMDEAVALGEVTVQPLRKIRLSKTNPRKIPERAVELVALSLKRFGWQQPLVVRHGEILAGHTRYLAAQSLGLSEVPTVNADHLTEEEAEAFRIADNRTHDFTTWDFPELVTQLDALADDFADVLALADWQGILDEFDAATAEAAEAVALPEGASDVLDDGFRLVVCFSTKEQALAAEAKIMEIDGVFDVRHKIRQDEDV